MSWRLSILLAWSLALSFLPACNKSTTGSPGGSHASGASTTAVNTGSSPGTNQSVHPWPTVCQNFQRTSCSPYIGPEHPNVKWQAKLIRTASFQQFPLNSSPLTANDGTVFVQTDRCTLNAIGSDGRIRWYISNSSTWIINQPFITQDGSLLGVGDSFYRVKPDSGELTDLLDRDLEFPHVFEQHLEFALLLPVATDLFVTLAESSRESEFKVLQSRKCELTALNSRGRVQWREPLEVVSISNMSLGAGGSFYLVDSLGKTYAFSNEGRLLWTYESTSGGHSESPVITSDQSILVYGGNPGEVVCLNPAGQVSWQRRFDGYKTWHLAVAGDGDILLSLAEPRIMNSGVAPTRKLLCMTSDGETLWEITYGDIGIADLSIDSAGVIYLPLHDGLYAYFSDGTLKWHLPLADLTEQASIGSDGTIYALGRDAILYAVGEAD